MKQLTDTFKWRPIKELSKQHVAVLVLYEGCVYTGWLDDLRRRMTILRVTAKGKK